jgi:hypothetical protein
MLLSMEGKPSKDQPKKGKDILMIQLLRRESLIIISYHLRKKREAVVVQESLLEIHLRRQVVDSCN